MENNHEGFKEKFGLVREFGLLQATALNMSNMVGVGPFITIPLIIASMGGPQCMLGWLLGTILALCDGLVWSELAAAMPGTGGTYLYLREAFRKTGLGGILPFLFIWQFIFSGPLEIASGFIGFAQYVGYFWRGMGPTQIRLVSLAAGTLVILLLYRRITAVGRLTVVLWVGMLVTVLWVIASGLINFRTLNGGSLEVDQLTDPTTLSTRGASVELSFPAVCNFAHQIVLESQNNGLWRSELGMTPAPTGFSDAVPYTATLIWGPVTSTFEADASSRQIRDRTQSVDRPVAGQILLRLRIQPGATNLQTNAPLVAGVYRDTLRLTVEPQ